MKKISVNSIAWLILITLCCSSLTTVVNAQELVPAVMTFGDSTVDVGNNNYLKTLIKSNFAPYGRDYDSKLPTGRFSNGRLATDYTAEVLGFTSFPLAYLDPNNTGDNLLLGANFASAGSGFFDSTAEHVGVIPISKQLNLFQEYRGKLASMVGEENASSIVTKSLYIVSSGSSDFLQNYLINVRLKKLYSDSQFTDLILSLAVRFIQDLYGMGARKIGVVSLPPLGCLPAQRSLYLEGHTGCVLRLNNLATAFNTALNQTIPKLPIALPGLKISYFDVYTPILDLIQNPASNGFKESRKACCGTGTVETAILCNQFSLGTCANASEYVFWDSFHPTQAANQIIASSLLTAGIDLVT